MRNPFLQGGIPKIFIIFKKLIFHPRSSQILIDISRRVRSVFPFCLFTKTFAKHILFIRVMNIAPMRFSDFFWNNEEKSSSVALSPKYLPESMCKQSAVVHCTNKIPFSAVDLSSRAPIDPTDRTKTTSSKIFRLSIEKSV